MNRRFLFLVGLAALLASPASVAQNAVAGPGLRTIGPRAGAVQVNPNAVHRVELADVARQTPPAADNSLLPRDTLVTFDDIAFFQPLSPSQGFIQLEERFTPPLGTTTPVTTNLPGQVTAAGFAINGDGIIGDGTLVLIFARASSGDAAAFGVAPTIDFAVGIPFSSLAAGFFNVVDLTSFNLFFTADEEFWYAFQIVDGTPNAEIQMLLDDGLATPTNPAFYNPVRSFLFITPPAVPPGDEGYYQYTAQNNFAFFAGVNYNVQAQVDVTLDRTDTPSCDTVIECPLPPTGGRVRFTGTARNRSTSLKRTDFTVTLFRPDGTSSQIVQILNQPIPPNQQGSRSGSVNIPAGSPAGVYEVRVDANDATTDELRDYDNFFFIKNSAASLIAGTPTATGKALSESRLVPMRPGESVTFDSEWTFADASAAVSASAAAAPTGVVVAPNPFSSQTTLRYTVETPSAVRLAVYDVLGREVAVLVDGTLEAGAHTATLDASRLAPGAYVYRLQTGDTVTTGRLTLAR